MNFITVVDDNGFTHYVAAAHILSIRPRPNTELGSIIRFTNGTTMNVVEGVNHVLAQIPVSSNCCSRG